MGVHVTFADGPLADAKHDRALNCAPPAAMWLAPQPIDDEPRTHDGWMLVGLGDRVPEIPYPGQVRYDLDEDAAGARAVYRQAGECYRWTIHEHPDDFPQGYVVRAWSLTPPHDTWRPLGLLNSPSLELARLHMPPGAWWNVGRLAEEDPSIVEVWI